MPRSGTNLARRLIGSHSLIAIPPAEFQFFKNLSKGKSVRQIFNNERLADWKVDFSDLYEEDPQNAYITALQRYTKKVGKYIPGEKSPLNEFYLEIIESWLNDFELKFVHLLRNPIDVIASYKHNSFRKNIQDNNLEWISAVAENWRRSASIGLARSLLKPNQHKVIKFENLTNDTENESNNLCKFLGVEFEKDRMLNLIDYAGHKDNTSFADNSGQSNNNNLVYQPPSRKQHLTIIELSLVNDICGELAWALGYIDENFKPTPPTKPELYKDKGIMHRIFSLPKKSTLKLLKKNK